jgi:hypothetical protein
MSCPSKRSLKLAQTVRGPTRGYGMGEKSKRFKIQKKFEKVVSSVCSLRCGLGRAVAHNLLER